MRSVRTVQDPAYWQALGRFIEDYAGVEILLFNYVVALSKMNHGIARIFYGKDQTDRLIEFANQITSANPLDTELQDKTALAFGQLKKISLVRNYLVHYVSFETSDKGRIISNITKVRRGVSVTEYRASVAELSQMTADLRRISHLLVYCLLGITRRATAERAAIAADLSALDAAWQYTQL